MAENTETIEKAESKKADKKPNVKEPECHYSRCFAYSDGKCTCLEDNDFSGKPCPFFKENVETK